MLRKDNQTSAAAQKHITETFQKANQKLFIFVEKSNLIVEKSNSALFEDR